SSANRHARFGNRIRSSPSEVCRQFYQTREMKRKSTTSDHYQSESASSARYSRTSPNQVSIGPRGGALAPRGLWTGSIVQRRHPGVGQRVPESPIAAQFCDPLSSLVGGLIRPPLQVRQYIDRGLREFRRTLT